MVKTAEARYATTSRAAFSTPGGRSARMENLEETVRLTEERALSLQPPGTVACAGGTHVVRGGTVS